MIKCKEIYTVSSTFYIHVFKTALFSSCINLEEVGGQDPYSPNVYDQRNVSKKGVKIFKKGDSPRLRAFEGHGLKLFWGTTPRDSPLL